MTKVVGIICFLSFLIMVYIFVLWLYKMCYNRISPGDYVSVLNIYTDEVERDLVIKVENEIIYTESHGYYTFHDFIKGYIA